MRLFPDGAAHYGDVKKLGPATWKWVRSKQHIEGWSRHSIDWGASAWRDFLVAYPPLNGGRSQFDQGAGGCEWHSEVRRLSRRQTVSIMVGIEREVAFTPAKPLL